MSKKINVFVFFFMSLFYTVSFASSGQLFNISSTGATSDQVNLTLCLDGKGALSCQNYTVTGLNLSINTTIPNHSYPDAGIKINTPGYALVNSTSGCIFNSNGYCIFPVSDTTPSTIQIISTYPNPITLPGGTTILQNGTTFSFSNNVLSVNSNKTSTIRLLVRKGNLANIDLSNLNLSYTVKKVVNHNLVPDNTLKISFQNPHVLTDDSTIRNIIIDGSSAQSGYYFVHIIVNNLPSIKNVPYKASNSTIIGNVALSISPNNYVQTSYLQTGATGSLSTISPSGYYATNMMIFAFANINSSTISSSDLSAMQTAMNNEAPGTINLLSIGGQTASPSTINSSTVPTIVSNIVNQINTANNGQLSTGKINGVDLDLEQGIDTATISALAQNFQAQGYLVSIAPQVYLTSGSSVDPTNPSNFAFTSGGPNNQYAPAIQGGYVDYIQAQTYNTGGWTINGYDEGQVQFFQSIAQTLNTTVQSSCAVPNYQVCIPQTTQVMIGEPSNAGGSGTLNNIFGSTGSTSYNQSNILNTLLSEWATVQTSYPNISGIMQWSLNNDYDPSAFGDTYATPGLFSTDVFGASPPPQLPYFILQISNNNSVGQSNGYASATLVVNGSYWIFGTATNTPIAPQGNQQWGTLTSAQNPQTPGVVDSSNLDNIFNGGNNSFIATQILANSYPAGNSNLGSPVSQFACPGGPFTFQSNHSYNIIVNTAAKACSINQVS